MITLDPELYLPVDSLDEARDLAEAIAELRDKEDKMPSILTPGYWTYRA